MVFGCPGKAACSSTLSIWHFVFAGFIYEAQVLRLLPLKETRARMDSTWAVLTLGLFWSAKVSRCGSQVLFTRKTKCVSIL